MDLSALDETMKKDESHFYSSNTDIVSSLQFDKRIKSRCYSSQFTLNDEILVAVNRREEYKPIENKVTIEVDISLGICDNEESIDKHYIVRLNDMASENAWVYRMINYDTFVDKDISNSIRDDAMEPNKLYLLQHKHRTKTEEVLNFNDSLDDNNSAKRKLRTTGSQFNPHVSSQPYKVDVAVNPKLDENKIVLSYEKNSVLRNELFLHTGTPRYEYITDKTYTSYINIDLSKKNTDPNSGFNKSDGDIPSVNQIVIPIHKQQENDIDLLRKVPTRQIFDQFNPSRIPINREEAIDSLCTAQESFNKEECIPFAEETDDEQSNRINPKNTLSKSLQYYLPTEKPRENCLDIHSDVSTCVESSTETESVNGYFDEVLISDKYHNNIACLDEFNNLSADDDSISLKDDYDEVDSRDLIASPMKYTSMPHFICDESLNFKDLIFQENMVLQIEDISSPNTMQVYDSEIMKETDEFVSVSLRRLQYEELDRHSPRSVISTDLQPIKIRLITSNNYADIVDREKLIKEETINLDNNDNELDKESSISFSSGSMVVKDVLSDDNFEFFLKHNNLEISSPDKSIEGETIERENLLGQVEEQSEYDESELSVQLSSARKTPENPEDESDSVLSDSEIDATSASSFTTSTNMINIALKNLTKTPIECDSGRFEKFLEERERRISEVPKSSLPVSYSQSSASLSDDSSGAEKDKEKQFSTDQLYENEDPNLRHCIKDDRNSPLTSISRTSSLSSSVFSTSSESPCVDNAGNTNTLIKIGSKDGVIVRRSVSSASYSLTDDITDNQEEIHASNDSMLMSKEQVDADGLSSSDWSSSSHRSYQDTMIPKSQIMYQPLVNENIPKKDIPDTPIESSLQKFEKFLEKRNKKTNDTSGTEDTSSSSSDYHRSSSNQMVLRHGDSIEDIEELLMQQTPKFDTQRSVPLRKQTSLPNNNRNTDSDHTKNKSMDHIEKFQLHNIGHMIKNSNPSNKGKVEEKKLPLITSQISFDSADKESDNAKNKSLDNMEILEYPNRVSTLQGPVKLSNGKDVVSAHSSSSSCTLSSSSDEDSDHDCRKTSSIPIKNDRSGSLADNEINKDRANSSSSGQTLSTSSDEESCPLKNESIDHREKFVNSKQLNTIEAQRKLTNSKEPISEQAFISSSDEESNNLNNTSTNNQEILDNDSTIKKQMSSFNNKDTVTRYSSASSHTSSSFSNTESNFVENKVDNFQNVSILEGRRNSNDVIKTEFRRSSTKSDPVSFDEICDAKQKAKNYTVTPTNDRVSVSRNSSTSSYSLSSSSDEDLTKSDHENNVSIDHREKFDNFKSDNFDQCHNKSKNDNESVFKDSSMSIDSEDLNQATSLSIDRLEKFDDPKKVNTIEGLRRLNCVDKPTLTHSSSGSCTLSSSSAEESEHVTNKAIDHQEKFDDPKRVCTIERQRKINNTEEPAFDSDSLPSSSDEEYEHYKNASNDHRDKSDDSMGENVVECSKRSDDKGTVSKLSTSSCHDADSFAEDSRQSDLINNSSIDHREKFDDPKKVNTIERQKKLNKANKLNSKYSATDSDTLSSSSDEESDHEKVTSQKSANNKDSIKSEQVDYKSIDHSDQFVDPKLATIKKSQNGIINIKDSVSKDTATDSDTLSTSMDEEDNDTKNRSIDHQEKFENADRNNTIKHQRKNKDAKDASTRSDSLYSSSDEEPEIIRVIKPLETISPLVPPGGNTGKEANTGLNKSIDHRETYADPRIGNTIEKQRKLCNGKETISRQSSSSSYTKSTSSNRDINKERGRPPQYDTVNPKLVKANHQLHNDSKLNNKITSSELSDSITSEGSFIFNKSNGENEDNSDRRYQTLPTKRPQNNIPIKERSKSLDKPVDVEADQFNNMNYRSSTIDMVEKKYHEYTETWSRHSPSDDHKFQPKVPTRAERELDDNSKKRFMGPFTNNPRPVPSYMSPVNAYSCVESDEEFCSNDSIASDYSVDVKACEISTRNSSVQDFVKEISNNKLYKAPLPNKQVTPKFTLKPKIAPKIIDLNYGSEEDTVDYSKPKTNRRTSASSVMTDRSYLDKPTLSNKPTKTSLAKLDSLTSSSMTSSIVQRNKSDNPNFKSNASISSISTSTSSLISNREINLLQSPPQTAAINGKVSNNQIYRERSQMINGSNIYPVKSGESIRRKIPSTSESSEYSTTSDEESSSKEFLETSFD